MTFRVATYNVLATAYLARGRYRTPPHLLAPDRRVVSLRRRAEGLGADLLCLQEVEPQVFAVIEERLCPLGYQGHFEQKAGGRPDGCATFFRQRAFALRRAHLLEYHDGEVTGPEGVARHSGSIALLLELEHRDSAGRPLGVANTHLRWDPPGTPTDRQVGYREALQLLTECGNSNVPSAAWIICGDFNRTDDSEVPALLRSAGFEHAHAGRPSVRTCVANGRARLIDFIFHGRALHAAPIDPPGIDDHTLLPSEGEPSDHLPLAADMNWGRLAG